MKSKDTIRSIFRSRWVSGISDSISTKSIAICLLWCPIMLHPSYNHFTTERICAPLCQQVQILTAPLQKCFFRKKSDWNNRGISVIIIMCPAGLCLLGTDLFTPCIRKTINVTLPMSDGRGAFIFLQSGENTKSKLRSIFKSGKNPVCQKRNLSPLFLPLLLRGLWSISWRSIARY